MHRIARRGDRPPFSKAYSFALITATLFLLSLVGHFVAQMVEVSNSAEHHGETFAWSEFVPQFLAATFENWQSEFLQVFWQVVGLSILFHLVSCRRKPGPSGPGGSRCRGLAPVARTGVL